jgi:hypothetical protein
MIGDGLAGLRRESVNVDPARGKKVTSGARFQGSLAALSSARRSGLGLLQNKMHNTVLPMSMKARSMIR